MSGLGVHSSDLLRILVVEDELLVAMMIEDMLDQLGCEVIGPAPTLPPALVFASSERLDGAILDVNVAGVPVFPVAETLRRRGIPFLFATGYGAAHLPVDFRHQPRLEKPFRRDGVAQFVEGLRRADRNRLDWQAASTDL